MVPIPSKTPAKIIVPMTYSLLLIAVWSSTKDSPSLQDYQPVYDPH